MRAIRWILPALVAAACAFAATPVLAADDGEEAAGVEVVEAGSALFPDRAYILTFAEPRGVLKNSDVTVTEDRKAGRGRRRPVRCGGERDRHGPADRHVQQHEELDRLGDGRGARVHGTQPRAAAVGRVLQREADGRAAADERPRPGRQGAREAAEARRGDAHLRRARCGGRPGPGLGARRRAHRAAVRRRRRRQRHLARLRPPAARGAEHPRLLRRHRVACLHPGRPREDRRRDGWRVRVGRLAGGADGGLRGARLPARERVPRQLPLAGEPQSEGRRQHRRRRRRGARLVLVPEPEHGDGGALCTRVPRSADAVVGPASRSSCCS